MWGGTSLCWRPWDSMSASLRNADDAATIDMRDVMQKRLVMTGSTLRGRSIEEKARLVQEVEAKVWPWVISGKLKPLIYKSFPIKNVLLAHKMMESGAHIGKIVLEVTD